MGQNEHHNLSPASSQALKLKWPVRLSQSCLDGRLGVSIYNSRQKVDWHFHDFYELVLVNRGSCIHQFRDRQDVLIPGDCFLVPLREAHAYAIAHETEIINCLFQPDVIDGSEDFPDLRPSAARLLNPGSEWRIYHLTVRQQAYIRLLLQQIAARTGLDSELAFAPEHVEVNSDQAGQNKQAISAVYDQIGRHSLALLLFELVRMNQQAEPGAKVCLSGSRIYGSDHGRQVVSCLLAYMRLHLREPITIRQLADQVHLSEGHCRRLFARYTGSAPKSFLNRLRLDEALFLLEKGNMTVREIADQVGFPDPGYFTRYFKKQLHATPGDYIRQSDDTQRR